MSTLYVDTITEKTAGNGVQIPGHVIGFAQANHNSQQAITSSSFVSLGLTVSYTAKKANSLIKVEYHLPSEIYDSGANNEVIGETALYLDGSNVGGGFQTINTSQNVLRSGSAVYSKYIQTAGDIASHTWTVYARVSGGIETFTCFRYGLTGYITLMEIAQ